MAAHRLPRRTDRLTVRAMVAVVLALAAVLTVGGVASAFFTSTGSGTGSATTGTLAAPSAVAGEQAPGTGTVHVTWTASSGSPAPTGYYLLRTPSSGPAVAACGTSATSTTPATSCDDESVPLGDFSYQVIAVYRSWTAASAQSTTVTVAQAAQMITITSSPVSPTFGGTYALTATGGGSGNPVTFSSDTPGVCTVAGSTATFVHAGSCTINADQAGSTYYASAPQSQQTFAVAKATQAISFTSTAPSAAVVDGPGYTPAATGGASGNTVTFSVTTPAVCTLNAGVVTHQHVGTCTVAANQAGNADYLAASEVQQSYTVGQGSQAITFGSTAPANAKVNDTYTATATGGASGNPVTFSSGSPGICSVTAGGAVTFTAAGTCLVQANQAGNADYLPASTVTQSIAVTKRDQAITFNTTPSSPTYGGSYPVNAASDSGLTVAITSATPGVCTVGGSTVTFVGAGTCTLNANQAGNGVYNAAPQVQQSFTVAKASQTITFTQPTSPVSAGTTATLVATASSGLAVTFSSATASVCTISAGTTVSYNGSGTCTINADQVGNGNYNPAAQVQKSVTVQAAFAITGRTSGSPQNTTTVSGVGSPGATVTVYLCNGSQTSCGASGPNANSKGPQTDVVAADGTWSVTFSKLGNGSATYTVQAVQSTPIATTPVFTFTT